MEFDNADLRDRMLADEVQEDLSALLQRTQAAIEADVSPAGRVRRLSTPARIALVLAVAVGTAVASLLGSPRADMDWVNTTHLGLVSAGMTMGALIGVALAMRPTWAPEASRPRAVGALLLALLLPALLVAVPVIDPAEAFAFDKADLPELSVKCFGYGSAIAFFVVGAWRLVERRTHAGALRWATAMAAAAAIGNVGLIVHCPVIDMEHKLAGHATIGLIWAGVAAVSAWLAKRR